MRRTYKNQNHASLKNDPDQIITCRMSRRDYKKYKRRKARNEKIMNFVGNNIEIFIGIISIGIGILTAIKVGDWVIDFDYYTDPAINALYISMSIVVLSALFSGLYYFIIYKVIDIIDSIMVDMYWERERLKRHNNRRR